MANSSGAQGVWATALSQGADIVNGDLYSPQNNGSHGSTYCSNLAVYYDYAMEMEPGTTDGSIYVFDPVFCATNNDGSQYGVTAGSAAARSTNSSTISTTRTTRRTT